MTVLLYSIIVLCCAFFGLFCAIQSYLMLSDAIGVRKGRTLAVAGGVLMVLAAAVCFVVFVWLLNHSPLD